MRKSLLAAVLALLALLPAAAANLTPEQQKPIDYTACGLKVKIDRRRPLEAWKPLVSAYSARHYGENTWKLAPVAIGLHYTAGTSFPWNLVSSKDFAGETPGLASHYVVDGANVWEIVPPTVRSRGAYGINHRAINIEMVAADAPNLARRPETLKTAARLTRCLMQHFGIEGQKIYSHQLVGTMDPKLVPEAYDKLHPEPYHKIDPGELNMATIRKLMGEMSSRP